MTEFIPETENIAPEVPFFEDVDQRSGWGGQATGKGENALQGEIAAAIGRLGGMVTGWQRGKTGTRDAYQMFYNVQRPDGEIIRGRMTIAALPLRTPPTRRGYETKKRQALHMALFNLRDQLENNWRMQHIIPGYFALLPFMLHEGTGKTFTEMWVADQDFKLMLPAPKETSQDEVVEGDFHEISD